MDKMGGGCEIKDESEDSHSHPLSDECDSNCLFYWKTRCLTKEAENDFLLSENHNQKILIGELQQQVPI